MDIVERLRRYRPTYGWPEERSVIVEPTLNHVAADEIERLREEVEHLHKMTVKWSVLQVEGSQENQRLRKENKQLRSQMVLFDPNTTQEMAAAALNFANDEIKRLQKNAKRDAKYMLALHRIRQTRGNEFMEAFDQAVKLYEDEQPAKATGGE